MRLSEFRNWHQRLSRPDLAIAVALTVAAFAVFAVLAPDSFRNGDMPLYAEQIINRDFSQRTTHIGYYFLGYLFKHLPFDLDFALNLMSTVFAAGTVAVVYLLAYELTHRQTEALASALVLLANDAFLLQAVHAEVYMPQTFFAVASLLVWVKNRPFWAGIFFACAFLISASSAFFLMAFPLLRRDARAILIAGLAATITTIAVLAPHANNYFFGARGLSGAVSSDVDFIFAVLKNGRDVFFGFYMLTPFLIAGILTGLREASLRPFTISVGLAWLANFMFGERYMDVPVQLPVYCLFAILTGIGIARIRDAGRLWILFSIAAAVSVLSVIYFFPVPDQIADHLPSTALLMGFIIACLISPFAIMRPALLITGASMFTAIAAYSRTIHTVQETDAFASASRQIHAKSSPNRLIVGHWNELMRFNWNARRKTYTEDLKFVDDASRISFAINEERQILVFGHSKPGEGYVVKRFGTLQVWIKEAPN